MSDPIALLREVRLAVTPEIRERHLTAVASEIDKRHRPWGFRRRLLVIALATVLALPVMALAAEDSVPGDFLYPLKRVVEPVVSVFDRDAASTHRVDEVEKLISRGAPELVVSAHVQVARDAVEDWPELQGRLSSVVDSYRRDHAPQDGSPTDHEPSGIITDGDAEDTRQRGTDHSDTTQAGGDGDASPVDTLDEEGRSRD